MPTDARRSRRLVDRLVAPYVNGLADHLARVQDSVLDLHDRLRWVEDRLREEPEQRERSLAKVEARLDEIADRSAADRERAALDRQMLREIHERGDEQRRRLYELRRSEAYELAFTEDRPLVSFVVPTFDRHELLRERSLPSILNQNYENLEVIVSGDGSPPETEQAIKDLDDPRLRFLNRTVRGPYPETAEKRWLMAGTPPLNDGVAAARGRWIAILGDDDEVCPEHTERLLAAAQESRRARLGEQIPTRVRLLHPAAGDLSRRAPLLPVRARRCPLRRAQRLVAGAADDRSGRALRENRRARHVQARGQAHTPAVAGQPGGREGAS